VALNRVISSNPSQIAGRIDANGQIILINQSGVIFDRGSQVNTAGLIVSAAGMSNVNFMAGKLVFDQAGNPNAAVVNQGTLTVKEAGLAALVAPQVANSGVITARLGHVVLAGAKTATLDMYGDGLLSLDVNNAVVQAPVGPDGKAVTALVTNTGVIQASGGTVQLTAREADGLVQTLVQAGGTIAADSVGAKTGTVVLGGLGGSISLSGVVVADGVAAGSHGGAVQVDASGGVALAAGSRVSASGKAGGGTVAIGTTLARAKGGPGVASALTAQTVDIAQGASVAANATGKGDGGRVTVLSLLSTSMAGDISATGGPRGGNGGFVEVSGEVLGLTGGIDVGAEFGNTGTILLDPDNLTVVSGASGSGDQDPTLITNSGTIPFTAPNTQANQVSNSAIDALTGNVILQARTAIVVDAPISLTAPNQTLTLEAGGEVAVLAAITAPGDIILATGGAGPGTVPPAITAPVITVQSGAAVTSTAGSVSLLAGLSPPPVPGNVAGPGGAIELGSPATFNAGTSGTLVAASGKTVTLQADTLALFGASKITAPNGAIEIAPATNTSAVTLAGTGGLSIPAAALADMSTGTLRIGAATINGTQTTTAFSVTVAGTVDLTGIATSLDLEASGAITGTAAPLLNVGTLTANGSSINLQNPSNTISNLANASAITFGLDDNTNLTVSGVVSAVNATISNIGGNLTITGTISAPTISLFGLAMTITGEVTDGGAGHTSLNAYTGGISETGGTVIAGTLTGSSVGSVSVGVSSDNTIAALGTFGVASDGGSFALTDTANLSITGAVSAQNGVYIESAGAAGIQLSSAASVFTGGGANISFQANAFGIANGGTVVGQGAQFELAPNTPGLAVTLGANGSGLSLASLTGISLTNIRIGAVTTPGNTTPTTTAGSIAVAGNIGADDIEFELDATGQVTEAPGAALSAAFLTGTAASFQLTSTANSIENIFDLVATGGDITVVDSEDLNLSDVVSGRNLFFQIATTGGTLTLGEDTDSGIIPAILTAASGGRISLVADNLVGLAGSTATATNGVVELAPFSPINTSLQGSTGLVIDSALLPEISTGTTGTLVVGGFTNVPNGATVPVASAASITLDGAVDLTGIASTLLLQAKGAITETVGPLTVGTLAATGGVIILNNPNNVITALGDVTSTSFTLNDSTALGLTGSVNATTSASITDAVSLTLTGNLTSPVDTLSAGNGGIALNAGAVLGESGATVDLSGTGAVSESGTATIVAATLRSTGGVAGSVTLGNTNTVASVGSFVVSGSGNGFQLIDSGNLTVSGPLTAPGGITLSTSGTASVTVSGNVGAGAATLSITAGSGGIALNGSATAGTLDLLTTGAVTQSAALAVGTLTGNVGSAVLGDNGNDIATLGSFAATTGAFDLNDFGNNSKLTVTGPVTAATIATISVGNTGAIDVTGNIGAGTTLTVIGGSGGVSVNGNAALTGTEVDLAASSGDIALNGNAVVGQSGASVNLITTGNITEATTATLIAATLQTAGGAVVDLAGTANAVDALSGIIANTSFTLNDSTNLTINDELFAPRIALLAPGQTVTLADGAEIITDGTPQTLPGPVVPSEEPANGAPGAFIEAAAFVQVGVSTLASQGGSPTLEITVTNSAQFDPPAGLQAPDGWLILNLGNGTATGNVFVNALNVTYTGSTIPGSPSLGGTDLAGTIADITGGGAARAGFIQPAINLNYLFNGCEIAAALCQPLPPSQPGTGDTPPFGPPNLFFVSGVPPLFPPPPLLLLAEPLAPAPADALTDPDVVPPNVSYVDY
jgi:hypothetical protein